MKFKAYAEVIAIALLIAMIGAAIIALWSSIPVPGVLATVSWNG